MRLVMSSITFLLARNLPAGSTMRYRLWRAWLVLFVALAAMLLGAIPTAVQGQSTVDYDSDDDGLIAISNLAQLNAIRWDLDGDGSSGNSGYSQAFPNAADAMGCPESRCWGYELDADLDFDTDDNGASGSGDDYWNDGSGWDPIGDFDNARFNTTFEGNGHTISNLFINRSSARWVGLFGFGNWSSTIRNLGLLDANVTGQKYVGAIAGGHYSGRIISSFSTGQVSSPGDFVGGLIGASYRGVVSTSYSMATVTGDDEVGGLVGWNDGASALGIVKASYATGAVRGDSAVGGLVGYHNHGEITASYATGAVSGKRSVGGLVGAKNLGTTAFSYWDSDTTGQPSSAGGEAYATTELRAPTDYTGIYADWNLDLDGIEGGENPWDFGDTTDYPVLKVDFDGNEDATWQEFGTQQIVPDAPTLTGVSNTDSSLSLTWSAPRSDGRSNVTGYDVRYIATDQDEAVEANWTLVENAWSQGTLQYTITGLTNHGELEVQLRAVNAVGNGPWSNTGKDYDGDNDGLIAVGNLPQLNAIRWDLDGDGSASDTGYSTAFPSGLAGMGCPSTGCTGYELTDNLDFDTNGSGSGDAGDDYWNDGSGWDPLGYHVSEDETYKFDASFDGNGHTISNLFINRADSDDASLFGLIGGSGLVSNVGLDHVDVTGRDFVGALAADNDGVISASYATGHQINGRNYVGGLVGFSEGTVRAAYASIDVDGADIVGGLVGGNKGSVRASYSRGIVSARNHVGSLVGLDDQGTISASYATGQVISDGDVVGGLLGSGPSTDVTDSYWDTSATGLATSGGGTGQTTNDLRSPTEYSGIYSAWDVDINGDDTGDDPWDFGGADVYPALKVDFDGNGTASWEEFGSQRYAVDYDADNDGLIEVSSLTQLNAIRWDLDGDGLLGGRDYAQAFPDAPAGMGCPSTGCTGFELTADLDFDTNGSGSADAGDDYWNDGAGWDPLGDNDLLDGTSRFRATFNGQGHAVSNLHIRRPNTDDVGLIGFTDSPSAIRNVALLSVNVTGRDWVGALAGYNASDATIATSFATGVVRGDEDVGGLVGQNFGTVSTSYSQADVVATDSSSDIGGLVGRNPGNIISSYATGNVSGVHSVGGLVGRDSGVITSSYSVGRVSGSGAGAGGLVGFDHGANITDSYWNMETSGRATSAGGVGKTTAELAGPTEASGIYASWNSGDAAAWDFGTTEQYPVLLVDVDGNESSTWQEFGDQRDIIGPGAPTVESFTPASGRLTVAWSAPPETGGGEITSYLVRYILTSRDQDIDANWTVVYNAWSSGALNYTITGLEFPAGKYTVQVKAANGRFAGDWSTAESTGTIHDPIVAVSNPEPSIGEQVDLTATLRKPDDGASYQWQRLFRRWTDVGPQSSTKRVIFDSAGTRIYRAVVTLSNGDIVRSAPLSLTWE